MKKKGVKLKDFQERANVKFGILPKLLAGTLIPLLVILTILGVQLDASVTKSITEINNNYLTSQTQQAASQINAWYQKYVGIAEGLAASQTILNGLSVSRSQEEEIEKTRETILKTLENVSGSQENIAAAWFVNLDTKELIQSNRGIGEREETDLTDTNWYSLLQEEQSTVITEAYQDEAYGTDLIVSVVSPVYANDRLASVVGLDVTLNVLTQMLENKAIGDTGYVTLYDSNGNILYHPSSDLIMQNAADIDYSANIKDSILSRQIVNGMSYTRNGERYVGATCTVGDLDYFILGLLPYAEYNEYILSNTAPIIVGFVVGIFILAVIVVFFGINITKQARKLAVSAGKIADGELDVTNDVSGGDEIGLISQEINEITV